MAAAVNEAGFSLKVDDAGRVVAIVGAERHMLGPEAIVLEEMCRLLAERDYGERRGAT